MKSNVHRATIRFATSFCLLMVALASLPLLAHAPHSADTFVSSYTPTFNYGSSIALVVQSRGNAYMKFNLSTLPAGATFTGIESRRPHV